MPLVPAHTWVESETIIQLQVPLKGHGKSKVDVFATECYLKVSFPPYLLEMDIQGCIDSVKPKARVENGILVIKANKKEGHTGIWGGAGMSCVDRKCSDPKVRIRREESIKEQLKREQELQERVGLRKHQDERLALRSQMSVEEAERTLIEEIKAKEKEKAEEEVYRAFAEMAAKQHHDDESLVPPPVLPSEPKNNREEQPGPNCALQSSMTENVSSSDGLLDMIPEQEISTDKHTTGSVDASAVIGGVAAGYTETNTDDDTDHEKNGEDESIAPPRDGGLEVQQNDSVVDDETTTPTQPHEHNNGDEERNEGEAVHFVPAPRAPIDVVPIGFTTRLFPTPLRESKVADESAWIMKNRRHLHKNKTLVGRLQGDEFTADISESDPVWLKGKGDDLYLGGDFLAAINAYTAALEADPEAATCLSNRAACHLRLGKPVACTADCGAALEILRALPETGPTQSRVLARRSLAYRELGHYRLSLEDCRAALGFSPGDAALTAEMAVAEPLALCETAKKEATARFASGDIAGACDLYSSALASVPANPSCLSNRAACHLALGRPQECVRDCTAALELLSADPPHGDAAVDCGTGGEAKSKISETPAPYGLIPPPGSAPAAGSDKRHKWVVSTVLRRGRANVQLGRLEGALRDYRAASLLDPDDKAVNGDVKELERRVQEGQRPLIQ